MVVSIMPCYDKKLEAIRFDIDANLKELDISITTVELLDLYSTITNQTFTVLPQESYKLSVDRLFSRNEGKSYRLTDDPVANGYVESLVKSLKGTEVTKKEIKNSDFIEYEFTTNGEKVKMAKCYGFRNIQKIVQSIKKGKCEYKYIEMMACPGGCYSGGGQIKVEGLKPK
jgi:iron only hydrogenase large subunit-like protein